VPAYPRLAFVLLLVLLLIDGLDGALARATGKASAFGAVALSETLMLVVIGLGLHNLSRVM
jgi:phosphatidylglycerophosphate synthase